MSGHPKVSNVMKVMSISMWAFFPQRQITNCLWKNKLLLLKQILKKKNTPHKWKKTTTKKVMEWQQPIPPNFPASTTNVATTQTSFCCNIWISISSGNNDKEFHFNRLVFLKANQRGLRALTTFHIWFHRYHNGYHRDSLKGLPGSVPLILLKDCMQTGPPCGVRRDSWVRTDSCGANGGAKDTAMVGTEQHPATALLKTSPEYTQPSLEEPSG